MIASTIAPKPPNASSCKRSTGESAVPATPIGMRPPGASDAGTSRSGASFSQPRPITIISPPKFGLSARFCNVRIGTIAAGALIATPQPYV
ncbi:hypothetical protein AQ477_17340 [Burkholderia thailandensis]|nr:hypothetical protein AQ477_17340 [Burkholderia thailandensis]